MIRYFYFVKKKHDGTIPHTILYWTITYICIVVHAREKNRKSKNMEKKSEILRSHISNIARFEVSTCHRECHLNSIGMCIVHWALVASRMMGSLT